MQRKLAPIGGHIAHVGVGCGAHTQSMHSLPATTTRPLVTVHINPRRPTVPKTYPEPFILDSGERRDDRPAEVGAKVVLLQKNELPVRMMPALAPYAGMDWCRFMT